MKYKETRLIDTPYPTVFYVGQGKTGSASLYHGIENKSVAHWHNTEYFCKIHNDYSLIKKGLNIYDYILELGNKYKFKPIIIESFRDPVAQRLSWYFQVFKDITATKAINTIQSDLWKIEENILIENLNNYEYYSNNENFELIYLRLEDINKNWSEILESVGISWKKTHSNKRINIEYIKANEKLKLSYPKLKQIYYSGIIPKLYSELEILNFMERWVYKNEK